MAGRRMVADHAEERPTDYPHIEMQIAMAATQLALPQL